MEDLDGRYQWWPRHHGGHAFCLRVRVPTQLRPTVVRDQKPGWTKTCWYFKRSQDWSFLVWTHEFYVMAVNSIENQNKNTELFAASLWPSCRLPKESRAGLTRSETGRHPLDDGDPLSATCPRITSLGEHGLACLLSNAPRLAENERAHTFQIISPLIGQTPLNYSRCATQGVIMTIRKMVTLRHAHLPRILTNWIFSLLSCCSLSTAVGCQSHSKHCRRTPRASWLWLERYIFLPPHTPSAYFFFRYFSKRKKNQKAKDDHNKINDWHFTQTKIFDIQEQLKDPKSCLHSRLSHDFSFSFQSETKVWMSLGEIV